MEKIRIEEVSNSPKHEVYFYFFSDSPHKAFILRMEGSDKHEIHIKKGDSWHYWTGVLRASTPNYFNALRIAASSIGLNCY